MNAMEGTAGGQHVRHVWADFIQRRDGLDLDGKVSLSRKLIREWYEAHDGQVFVSVSGGLDSTVLAHLVRTVRKGVPFVYFDSPLEFPENRRQCQAMGAEIVRSHVAAQTVLQRYGYPVASKLIAQYVSEVQRAMGDTPTKRRRLTGINSAGRYSRMSRIPARWLFLCDAPFPVSDRCCLVYKKRPSAQYVRQSGRAPFLGTRAEEGNQRLQAWYLHGCNAFDVRHPRSTPLAWWTHEDVWAYVRGEGLTYSALYDRGYQRSGCMFCMFGCHLDNCERFRLLAETHPKVYRHCMETLGCRDVLDYVFDHLGGSGSLPFGAPIPRLPSWEARRP